MSGTIGVGVHAVRGFSEHRMGTYAAALAYRGLFALFPLMLLLAVLVGVFGPPNAFGQLVEEIKAQSSEQVPQHLQPVVEQGREQIQPLEEMARRAQREAEGGLLLFGVAVALWSVSALASTLADAFNTTHGLTETRRWWKVQALSLASGPVVVLAVVAATVLLLTGPQVAERVAEVFGVRELFVLLWGWLRFPLALALLWVAMSFVYRYCPAVTQPLRSVMLGAALAVLAWAIASVGFSVYLANFADFGVTYGSLGAAVGLLVYLNLSATIVLAGAELNAAIHASAADRRTGDA
ncbi:hypothetical protein AVDCRST_MAG82-601 [uncultured Rubrobacteraceae bacterium]|uniref:Uncharacterized protein n=1 Tax=uncultured Rubrobacteraceae bacterium TaxID=349277 RepID=A0A6J4P7E8_9ACTN|nr:hypothetical protein AVDCRST_MAG82-601 [uncultured Rubrobacteraceae bacterium]